MRVRMYHVSDAVQGESADEGTEVKFFPRQLDNATAMTRAEDTALEAEMVAVEGGFGWKLRGILYFHDYDIALAGHLFSRWVDDIAKAIPIIGENWMRSSDFFMTQSWRDVVLLEWRVVMTSMPQSDFARAMIDDMLRARDRVIHSADAANADLLLYTLIAPLVTMVFLLPLSVWSTLRVHSLVVEPLRILLALPRSWREQQHARTSADGSKAAAMWDGGAPDKPPAAHLQGHFSSIDQGGGQSSRTAPSQPNGAVPGQAQTLSDPQDFINGRNIVKRRLVRAWIFRLVALGTFNVVFWFTTNDFLLRSVAKSELLVRSLAGMAKQCQYD